MLNNILEVIEWFVFIFSILYVLKHIGSVVIELLKDEPTKLTYTIIQEISIMAALSYIITFFII